VHQLEKVQNKLGEHDYQIRQQTLILIIWIIDFECFAIKGTRYKIHQHFRQQEI
jgi:hypothetical protein